MIDFSDYGLNVISDGNGCLVTKGSKIIFQTDEDICFCYRAKKSDCNRMENTIDVDVIDSNGEIRTSGTINSYLYHYGVEHEEYVLFDWCVYMDLYNDLQNQFSGEIDGLVLTLSGDYMGDARLHYNIPRVAWSVFNTDRTALEKHDVVHLFVDDDVVNLIRSLEILKGKLVYFWHENGVSAFKRKKYKKQIIQL